MDALDGNAIGGLLIDVFGAEMTAAGTTCAACGASKPVAELAVYRQAPGTVVRCRTCDSVLMVFVRRGAIIGVDLSGLAGLVPCAAAPWSRQQISFRDLCAPHGAVAPTPRSGGLWTSRGPAARQRHVRAIVCSQEGVT